MKLKQLLSVVLMLCMIASSCVGFAAPDYDAKYTTSDVSFGYVDGKVWTDATSLTGGSTVSAKVSASTSGDKENMVFSLFVYKNGKMYDCEVVTKEVGADAVEFVASADVPADSEGCQAVAVLWNNFYDMDMICDSALFPGTNTKLRGLYVDGVLVEGFDPDVTEYNYALASDAQKYPEISWEKVDSSAKVTYTKPISFPGRSVVSVEGAAGEKTEYVVKYISESGDFISNIGGMATTPMYVQGGLKVGAKAYNDRQATATSYIITGIGDPNYEGADLILGSIGWQSDSVFKSTASDWITFDAARGVTVKVLKSDDSNVDHFTKEGWIRETTKLATGFVQTTTNAVKNHKIALSKHFDAGKVSIPAGGSVTTYLVAIMIDPLGFEGEEGVDESLVLESISIDGVALEGFNAETNEYTHVLTKAQLTNAASPEVTYTLADATSSVTMERPSSFPGSVVITVMGKNDETNTYTINYNASVVENLALNEAAGTNAPKPQFKTNYKLGDATYADRGNNFLAKHIDDEYLGKDRILYSLGWKNDYDTQYHLAFTGDTIDWVTFTAKRETEVMVFEAANAEAEYVGFKAEYSADPYIVAQASSNGDLNYKYKYTKTFAAGEKVVLPNVDVANRIGMVVLNYAPWGGFDAEGGDEPVVPPVDPDTPVVPDEPEEDSLEIMKVKDGKDSIVVFVHDDGDIPTVTFLKDEFIENGLKGSVGLVINGVKDSNKATWQELFDTGVLNAESHSMTHTYAGQDNTKDETAMVNGVETFIPAGKMKTEIADSKTALKELFPNQNPLVYIRPGVGTITDLQGNTIIATSANAIEMMKENYIAARVTGRTAYTKEGVDTIPPTDYYAMYSIMPGSETTAEEIMESVDEAVEKNGILVFCFHGISDTIANSLTTRKSEADQVFTKVGEYVAEDKVWNPFYADAVKYMKETETAKATMETTGDAIEVTVTDELDNEIFDYPLTVKVPVPGDWEYALLTQGERTESNLKTFTENGETFVYANVVPDAGKATVVKSELIVDDLALTEIRIDGNAIKNFKADVTEYTHSLTPAQAESVDAPVVTYTLEDADSSAVVTNPTEFPGSVTITVTNKDSETRTYTVIYKADAVLTDIAVADPAAKLPEYATNGFVVGAKPYFERDSYSIQEINDESLVGKSFFKGNIEWQNNATFNSSTYTPWITLNSQRAVKLTILKTVTNGYAEMVADGFTYTISENANGYVKADTNSEKNFKYAFTKEFEAGEVVIPNGMANKAYFVVFCYAPWGGFDAEGGDEPVVPPVEPDEPVETALVKAIKLDGNAIAGFNAETLTYNVTLTDDQMASSSYPEVTVELNDAEASAVVTDPTSFPGSAKIEVVKDAETKIYTVNYFVPEIEVALSEDAHEKTTYPKFVTGMNVGDKTFADRGSFPIEAINDFEITSDIIWLKTNLDWKNTSPVSDVYLSTNMPDFISFTAKRGMVVTIYEDTSVNESKFNYWTTETSSTPYIVATNATPLEYIVKHQRYFAPGEKVEIPNVYGNRIFTGTIKYLGWDEEAPELDVNVPVVRKISDSDLVTKVTKGEGINVTGGSWSGLSDIKTTKYQLSKEFADITAPTEISITTDKIAKGYGIIVVSPLGETDDKNVIVNPDGSDIEWEDYEGVVVDYSYTNDGAEDFDPANATYVKRNGTAVTSTGSVAYVYETMNNSDDKYITGSALATTRNPFSGELHWTGLPEEYLGCNYIVVPFDGGFNGGEKSFTFTVDQPVKVWVHSSSSNMTVTDTIDDTQWTASQYVVRRRYQNVLDHLSCAYMLRKGYINESNIVFDGKVGDTYGVRFNRYDVYENLKADCGTYLGWAIDPEKVEATGFTNTINDYRYEEYLEAWVD